MNELIARAAQTLSQGELVAFPTETVYGLGADANNPLAVAKIFALKGRPENHPLIVHLASPLDIAAWAASIPDYAERLIAAFMPGPITLILPKKNSVLNAVTGGQDSVGLRVPAHPMAQSLLQLAKSLGVQGVAAPSANRFGRISPTRAAHVSAEFGANCPALLDGGASSVGIESTIIDCTQAAPRLLRAGLITAHDIEQTTGIKLIANTQNAPRVSGNLAAHYAPQTPLVLIPYGTANSAPKAVRYGFTPLENGSRTDFIAAPVSAKTYAQLLYGQLRSLDNFGAARIEIERPKTEWLTANEGLIWHAVLDRLERAAVGSGA